MGDANNKYSSAAKFVNTSLSWYYKERNTEFKQYDKKIYLVASKKIRAWTEIIAFYGEETMRIIKQT